MIIDFLISIPLIAIFILVIKLIKTLRSKSSWKNFFDYEMLAVFIMSIFIETIFLGLIHIIFLKTNTIELLFLGFFSTIFSYVVDPYNIYLLIHHKNEKKYNKSRFALIGIFLLSFALEISIFNTQGFNNHLQEEKVSFVSERVHLENGAKVMDDGTIYLPSKSKITIDLNEQKYSNIYFKFNDVSLDLTTNFYTDKSNFSYLTNPKKDIYNYMELKNVDNSTSLTIEFKINYSHEDPYFTFDNLYLKEISFNSQMPLSFNFIRLMMMTLLFSSVLFFPKIFVHINNKTQDNTNSYKRLELKLLVIFGITMVFYISSLFIFKNTFLVNYRSLDIADTNIYYQQFDAVLKGQLYLDIPVDKRLLAIDNPYDPANLYGISYYWDHAFYNGKYYCYYGIGPVLFVIFPIYFLSGGYLPSLASIQQIGMILTLFGLLFAEIEAVKCFTKKSNYSYVIFLLISSIFLSLTFYITSYKVGGYFEGIYHVPYAYGLANMFWTFFFVLKAYNSKNNLKGLYLSLASVFIVLMMLSRPNLIVTFIFLFPLYLKMLLEKNDWKKKILQFAPCVLIVLLGAVSIMIFNKARFDSVFEFGQSYQLTVTNQTNLKVNYYTLISAVFHFYFQLPALCNSQNGMPIFDASYLNLHIETHPYVSYTMGLFSASIFLICFFIPACFTKEDNWYNRISLILLPISSVIIATVTMGYAGICVRYNLDIFPIMAFSTTITIAKLLEKYNDNLIKSKILLSFITFFMIVSILISFDYIFVRFDGITGGDLNGFLFDYSSFWGHYNLSSNISIFVPLGILIASIPCSILYNYLFRNKKTETN